MLNYMWHFWQTFKTDGDIQVCNDTWYITNVSCACPWM